MSRKRPENVSKTPKNVPETLRKRSKNGTKNGRGKRGGKVRIYMLTGTLRLGTGTHGEPSLLALPPNFLFFIFRAATSQGLS